MSFAKSQVVLVQFHMPADWVAPAGVRDRGEEDAAARAKREASYDAQPMKILFERYGASLSEVGLKLIQADLRIVDAYVETRIKPVTEHRKKAKSYRLLTFVFRKLAAATPKLLDHFIPLACKRYEVVSVRHGTAREGGELLCLIAKSVAMKAHELKPVEDGEAQAYGILRSKAVPKESRKPVNIGSLGAKMISAGLSASTVLH